jgi:hypothetical protein
VTKSEGVTPVSVPEETPWSSYAGGFNGVAFRFAAADEAHERVSAAFSAPNTLKSSGPRLRQEEALFSFYVNAVSAVECLYFGLYNVGACLGTSQFRVTSDDDLRQISIGSTVKAFLGAYPKDVTHVREAQSAP